VLINGQLVQNGTKTQIFEHPASEDVARYLNYTNIFHGNTEPLPSGTQINLGHFRVIVDRQLPAGKPVTVCLRQQDIKIIIENAPIKDSLQKNIYPGTVVDLFPLPESCLMWFRMDGSPNRKDFELKFPLYLVQRHNLYPNKKIRVALWEPTIILFQQD